MEFTRKHQTGFTAAIGGSSCGGLVELTTCAHIVSFGVRATTVSAQTSSICATFAKPTGFILRRVRLQ